MLSPACVCPPPCNPDATGKISDLIKWNWSDKRWQRCQNNKSACGFMAGGFYPASAESSEGEPVFLQSLLRWDSWSRASRAPWPPKKNFLLPFKLYFLISFTFPSSGLPPDVLACSHLFFFWVTVEYLLDKRTLGNKVSSFLWSLILSLWWPLQCHTWSHCVYLEMNSYPVES